MNITSTIPAAWAIDTAPACPPWCTEPASHHTTTEIIPGDWTRFHFAYRGEVPTSGRPVTVEVTAHASSEHGSIATEPAGLTITYGEHLTPASAARLLMVPSNGTSVRAWISDARA